MPDSSTPVPTQDTLNAARAGDAQAAWTVYEHFHAYERQFSVPETEQLDLLQRAAQAGHPDAQFETAKLLRGGWLRMADGHLRATDEAPSQANLNEARKLLDAAAAQGHARAIAMLENLPPAEWYEQSVTRSPFGTHQPLLRTAALEREDDELMPRRTSPLLLGLVAVAVVVLLFVGWWLYTAKVHDRLG